MGNEELYFSILGGITAILAIYLAWLNYRLHKRKIIDEVLSKPLTSSKKFYEACERIHDEFSHVRILSKTPGILLPSERNAAPFRIHYFDTNFSKLAEGKYRYQLKYLFDIEGFIGVLKSYKAKKSTYKSQIQTVKKMLRRALSFENLDLRTTNTGLTAGLVIGGQDIAAVGFKDPSLSSITEGMVIKSSELVKLFLTQYDTLFQKAKRVNINFINSLIKEKQI